jgi:uncharacterized protein (TIGR03435 family)
MRSDRTRPRLLLIAFSFAAIPLLSQARAERLSFELASIKERIFVPGPVGVDFQPGGRMLAYQAPVTLLITTAYSILPSQLEFSPDFKDRPPRAFYDIEAKAEAGAIPPGKLTADSERKMQLMLQALLADRFKLKMHTEKRELPVYALVVDKNGLKLAKAPQRDCEAKPTPCRWQGAGPASGINGQSRTLADLADILGLFSGRSVVNKTGIDALFDINIPAFSRGAVASGSTADGVPVDVDAPSLSTVLQEIGLRLEPQKQTLDVYVVDHIEKPTAN